MIKVNMTKALEIKKDMIRAERQPKLEALDVEFMRAVEQNDTAKQEEITLKKQALRDATDDPILSKAKTPEELINIATEHFGADQTGLYREVAAALKQQRVEAEKRGARQPSTAEFLDALIACKKLDIAVPGVNTDDSPPPTEQAKKNWTNLIEIALAKRPIQVPAPDGSNESTEQGA